jgi:hypothetical protein
MFSSLSGENIGVKWRPIRTTDGNNRKKNSLDDSERVYALHLEAASDRARAAREKLKQYYGSGKTQFPDGTKMRLVPPFNTILSLSNKGKYATLIARQAALSSCMGVGTTWEMSTNLLLDRPEPSSKVSLRQLLMNIPSQVFPGKPLFHSLDKQWRSENVVTFCFLPENEADARTMIAGLIPYIRDTHDPWYLSAFLTEAKLRHQSSRWDHKTRQVFSAEEAAILDFLTEDDELNHTDIPTEEKASTQPNPDVEVNVPPCTDDTCHHFHEDADSVSTFHPSGASVASAYSRPSAVFQTRILVDPPSLNRSSTSSSLPTNIDQQDGSAISKLSNTASRIADIESNISLLSDQFTRAFQELCNEYLKTSREQRSTQSALNSILELLQNNSTSAGSSTTPFGWVNLPQVDDPSNLLQAAGRGS